MTKQARTLTKQRINQALSECKTQQERVIFLLSVRAGLRAKEIAGLLWEQVDWDDKVLLLKETKGDKPRRVPIAQDLWEALQLLQSEAGSEGHVLRGVRTRQPMSANLIAVWFRKFYTERLGWEDYSSHSGRRTFVTQAARKIVEAGGSLKDVQALAGHSDLRTTARYIDTDEDAQRRVVDLI